MKKNYVMMAFLGLALSMSACYNDDELWDKIDELETKAESNASDISTLSALVDAMSKGKLGIEGEDYE